MATAHSWALEKDWSLKLWFRHHLLSESRDFYIQCKMETSRRGSTLDSTWMWVAEASVGGCAAARERVGILFFFLGRTHSLLQDRFLRTGNNSACSHKDRLYFLGRKGECSECWCFCSSLMKGWWDITSLKQSWLKLAWGTVPLEAPGPAQCSSSFYTAGWSMSWCLKACRQLLHAALASSNQVLPHVPSLWSHLQPHLFLPPDRELSAFQGICD